MDKIDCDLCDGKPPQSAGPLCSRCGDYIGHPNIRDVQHQDEKYALETRYQETITASEKNATDENLKRFEDDMRLTQAVINIDMDFLYHFVTVRGALYSSYGLQTEGEVRQIALSEDDKRREGVEHTLFGSYAKHIRYAALSLDGHGLTSYGAFTLQLRQEAIAIRASLLEDNSYDFIKKHQILAVDPLPLGYRASWQDRHKLAVAKHGTDITENTIPADHAGLLLSSNGNRTSDSFIEVHIYGPFDLGAIEAVRGKVSTKNKREVVTLEEIKEYLHNAGILFEDQ